MGPSFRPGSRPRGAAPCVTPAVAPLVEKRTLSYHAASAPAPGSTQCPRLRAALRSSASRRRARRGPRQPQRLPRMGGGRDARGASPPLRTRQPVGMHNLSRLCMPRFAARLSRALPPPVVFTRSSCPKPPNNTSSPPLGGAQGRRRRGGLQAAPLLAASAPRAAPCRCDWLPACASLRSLPRCVS